MQRRVRWEKRHAARLISRAFADESCPLMQEPLSVKSCIYTAFINTYVYIQDYSICEPGFVARAPGFVRVIHEPINYSKKTRLLKRLGFVRELSDCDPRYGLDTATRAQCCLAESALNRISSVMRVESMGIGKRQLEMGAE